MREMHSIISNVELKAGHHCLFRSNHVSNYVQLAGTLPKDKSLLLAEMEFAIEKLDKQKDWDVYNNTSY
jgi:hypothetical protein